ncbi:MAG: alpha/beta hydrolase [Bacteroidetes bacterium]|nr:alpha/beta hydrolase [Bacteroidota bacterium]MBL6943782.1 alpha/beta hydrolase [Bacteroidales bacterium]
MSWDKKHEFSTQKLKLKDDWEGEVEATLIVRKAKSQSDKAILYIHGFVDYFFQNNLADWANNLNINFYALDLRKHGRSLLPHQKPNMSRSMLEYMEEIDLAIDIIRKEDANNFLILLGHSTGGLISSLYAHNHRDDNRVNALILNSPFFDFNKPAWFKKTVMPLVGSIGLRFPNLPSPEGLKEGYVKSIHDSYHGEWDFNLDYKPLLGFKINLGWIAAIYWAQKNLQSGLEINCPVLVMYSSKSSPPGKYNTLMHTSDSVLDVDDIKRYSKGLGKYVKNVEIENGLHDLVLSKKEVRENVFNEMTDFVENIQ